MINRSLVGWNRRRVALVVVDTFAAVTAIGGGIALGAGLEAGRFPAAWLSGTPFDSYAWPGLILAVLVGGSAAVGAAATLRSPVTGGRASILAGVVLLGWIVGEVLILTADQELISPTEVVYLAGGLLMIWLARAVVRGASRVRREP